MPQEPPDPSVLDDIDVGPSIPRDVPEHDPNRLNVDGITAHQSQFTEDVVRENQNTPFEVAIYTSQRLADSVGRIPERVAAIHLIRTFREWGRDLRVIRGLPFPDGDVDFDGVSSTCEFDDASINGIELFEDWLESQGPVIAGDSNICLFGTSGGGCGRVGGNVAVMGANNITQDRGLIDTGTDDYTANLQGIMHEIAHNMNYGHCATESWRVHGGWATNNDQARVWEKTPETACNPTENFCGEFIPERRYDQARYHLRYHDCTFETMKIVDKPVLGFPDQPIATFTWTPQPVVAGEPVRFDASGSAAPEGESIESYEWTFGDLSLTGPQVDFVYPEQGEYEVSVTVESSGLAFDTTTRTVQVESSSGPALALAGILGLGLVAGTKSGREMASSIKDTIGL